MPNDAKMGMILGVGLVVAIAVVFFRRDALPGPAPAQASSTTSVTPPAAPLSAYRGVSRTVRARTAIRVDTAPVRGQKHIVAEGETLFSLAVRYYQDERKFVDIYNVNRDVLPSPEKLTPGTVLVIPDLP